MAIIKYVTGENLAYAFGKVKSLLSGKADSNLSNVDRKDLAKAVDEAGFKDTVVNVSWLDIDDDGVIIQQSQLIRIDRNAVNTPVRADSVTGLRYAMRIENSVLTFREVPGVANVTGYVAQDTVTGTKYAFVMENGGLSLLEVDNATLTTECVLCDTVTGKEYNVTVENGVIVPIVTKEV